MKSKWAVYIFLALALSACSDTKHISHKQKKEMEGVWAETWIGVNTDVDDVDTIRITFRRNQIRMSCYCGPKYTYDSIFLTKRDFRFRMENTTDSSKRFFVTYHLSFLKQPGILEGPIRNTKNQTDSVRLIKIGN